MDFELNEEQKMLQESAGDFLKRECPKELVRRLEDSDEQYSPELWRKMAELGWVGLHLPEEYGGTDWSFLHMAVLLEEMGYNICPAPFISTTILGCVPILEAGTEDQKRQVLPAVARGELILTMALTESDGGYEPSTLKVTAARAGDLWVIDGVKLFVPDALVADTILCVARTSEASDPEAGLTLFLVRRDHPGVTVTPLRTISRDNQCEVAFDKVRLDADSVIGPVDRAWPVVKPTLRMAAVARAAETVGAMRATLDMTVAYAKERVQFGRPIGSFQAIQHFLADMWVDMLGTRNLVLQAAWKLSTDEPADKEVSMAKVRAGAMGRRATTVGHRIFAGIGFTMEHDLHLYHRRTLAGDLAFGDSDFHHEQVARSLGL
ncbi:acyl-CoA/acyl-ACP dehydrogenase [bacterium]|nr:acyl-CoA/acyl-ACP dehydrogenase [bacterium]